jgi:hypothetical protein
VGYYWYSYWLIAGGSDFLSPFRVPILLNGKRSVVDGAGASLAIHTEMKMEILTGYR